MKLKKLEVNAFGGINPNSPVVIDFTQSKFVTLEADQGQGKTTMLNALLVACGQLSKENKDFVNIQSGKIDINFDFIGKDGYAYNVRCTKSSFILSYEGEAVPEPITKMKELLGVVGVSPMEIKKKPLKEIVKWLAGYSNQSAEDFEKKMDKYKKAIKDARDTRADANRSLKGLNEFLNNEDMFNNWDESAKKYTKEVDIKKLSAELGEAGKESDKYLLFEERLKQKKNTKTKIVSDIEDLENQLAAKKLELKKCDEDITKGDNWLKENSAAKKNYDEIKKRYDSAAQDNANFNKWKEIKKKAKERDEFETIAQDADATEKVLLQKVKDLQAEILPDIKGVSLVTEDTHEDGKLMKEGLYWNGKNFAQLSESETWDIVLQMWRKYKVKVVVVDNYTNLGSMAAEILNRLSKEGAYILAAEMNREQKTLQINY